jgi:hypothetical protein
LSVTNSFTVTVNEVNSAPVLPGQSDRTIAELTTLTLTNTATEADLPANVLTYQLLSSPTGASISPSGVISWTPGEGQGPSTATFTTVVTDNGTPALSATNRFTVTVNEVNSAPVLPGQSDRTITELTTLTVTNTATDGDLPANVLTYQLVSPPAGASINASGLISWTPGEGQGPSTATFTTIVTDNGTPALSATNSFTVTVNEMNISPVLPAQADRTIQELTTLSVTNTATDPDLPADVLSYQVLSPPAGASISASGVISWTPSESQGPSTATFTTIVTDDRTPPLSNTNSFTVVVNEANSPPVVNVPNDQTIDELATLVLTNTATDPDLPANTLTFSLISAPSGMSLDSTTGLLTWTPTEVDGPSTNQITVRATDNGSPPLSDTNSFTVFVKEVNSPPVLGPISNRVASLGVQLIITNFATDSDMPANLLTFSLDPAAPAGAEINPTNGLFTWTPTTEQVPSTNFVTVLVTDNDAPGLSDAQSFTIFIVSPPIIGEILASEDSIVITWYAIPRKTYRVQFKSDPTETSWSDLPGDVTASDSTAMKTDLINANVQRYYRVLVLP